MRNTIAKLCQKIRGNRLALGICGIAMLPFAAIATEIQLIKTDDAVLTKMAEQAPICVLVVAVVFFVLSVTGFLMPADTESK